MTSYLFTIGLFRPVGIGLISDRSTSDRFTSDGFIGNGFIGTRLFIVGRALTRFHVSLLSLHTSQTSVLGGGLFSLSTGDLPHVSSPRE